MIKHLNKFVFIFLCISGIFCVNDLTAQDRYVLQLADKNNSPFNINNPSAFLSPRSIARRQKQNIAITTNDLPVNPSYLTAISNTGATILNYSKWLNTVTIQTADTNILNACIALPFVLSGNNVGRVAQPNEISEVSKTKFSEKYNRNNPFAEQSNSTSKVAAFNYGPGFHQINMMNGDALHNSGYSGDGMMIAIMDAGFWRADSCSIFDSLFMNNQIVTTWDFVLGNSFVFDYHSHGSSCLSTMAANLPGVMVGSAPHAKYILLRTEDGATENIIEEYNWAAAAEFADSIGADVFTTSLGYTLFDNPAHNHTYAQLDGNTAPMTIAEDLAAEKGIVVINSAGNEGNSAWNYVSVPADADSNLAIGAVDSMEQYASFSGKGPTVDGRVKPDVCAQGAGTYVVWPGDGSMVPGNGTSFSGPLLAGLAACLWQTHPMLSNMDIVQAIKKSASQYAAPDSLLGYGIPDFTQASMILGGIDPTSLPTEDEIYALYPNPSSNDVTVMFFTTTAQTITVSVYDAIGRKVFANKMDVAPIFINEIPIKINNTSGVYNLEIINEAGTKLHKSIVRQ